MRKLIYLLLLALSLSLLSCSSVLNNLPGVYSLDVQQGNMIDQGMIDQLRPKMSKRQVLYIMGSSMLIDVLHQKRWDYLYSEQLGGQARRQKRLSLFFDGDELIGIQGDYRPSTLPVIKESKETSIDVPKRNLDKTLWEKITGLFSDDESTIPEAETDTEANEESIDEESNIVNPESSSELNESSANVEIEKNIDTGEDVNSPTTVTNDDPVEQPLKEVIEENTDISIEPLKEETPQVLEEIQN